MIPWQAKDRTDRILLWIFWVGITMALIGTIGKVVAP